MEQWTVRLQNQFIIIIITILSGIRSSERFAASLRMCMIGNPLHRDNPSWYYGYAVRQIVRSLFV